MTSKKLLNNLNLDGVCHIDCTYKLIKNGFPVLIFGITDRAGQFHPIAYHITSHEEEADFICFYEGLKNIAKRLNIKCSPQFIMQDAWSASYNAARKCFPTTEVLMCFYHVMDNVKKHFNLLNDKSDEFKESVLYSIREIHLSKTETECS